MSPRQRTLLALLAVGVAGALLGAWLIRAAELRSAERAARTELLALTAGMAARLEAPLAVGDDAAAEKVLRAWLVDEDLCWLAIYRANGERLAFAGRHGESIPMRLRAGGPPHAWSAGDHLGSEHPVRLGGETVGVLAARRDLSPFAAARRRILVVAAGSLVVALLLAGSLARTLSRRVPAPIAAPVGAADGLAMEREVEPRVPGAGSPELARVGPSFRRMLGELRAPMPH